MTSLRRDLVCSAVLFLVAAVYFLAAGRLGATALSDAVGPAGLPRVYGAALGVLAIIIGAGALLRRRLTGDDEAREESRTLLRLSRAAVTLALGAAYLAIVDIIGYPFAIAALIAATALYQGERASWRIALVAVAGAAMLYVLFELVLGVSLPAPWNR